MKLMDACLLIQEKTGKPFCSIFTREQLQGIIRNKGKSGQILQNIIGLQNTSSMLDFEDGELKTNKVDQSAKPMETMFITQILEIIDDLLNGQDFYESRVYNKIKNLLYVPICKEPKSRPEKWFLHPPIPVDFSSEQYQHILVQLKNDYYLICGKLNDHIINGYDGFIHTSNGEYMQIRTKDSKPYSPIFSKKYARAVSNKNHAFYFKKEFMKEIQRIGYGN